MKKSLELIQIQKQIDGLQILNQINLSLENNQFTVLLGPSGSGKTTLLKIIAELDNEFSGQILNNSSSKTMFFQSYALFPYLNVFDNIAISLASTSLTKKEISERILKTAQSLSISDLLDRKVQDISGGEAQRVALARTIVCDATLCLMDEPLSHLDTTLRFDTMKLIKKLHNEKQWTTVYVTHDQNEAIYLADTIILMNEGKIEQIGTYDELYHHPKNLFVAKFIGNYPINIISGKIINGTFIHPSITLKLNHNRDKECLIGIRNEDIHLTTQETLFPVTLKSIQSMGEKYLCEVILNHLELLVTTKEKPLDKNQYYLNFDLKNIHVFDIDTNNKID